MKALNKNNNFARLSYSIDRTPYKMEYQSKTYYLIYDRLGSLRAISDHNGGRISKRIDYDSFGNVIREDYYDSNGKIIDDLNGCQDTSNLDILSLDIPIGFAGGLYDKHTNLIRFGYTLIRKAILHAH